jgi:hypothetical protein
MMNSVSVRGFGAQARCSCGNCTISPPVTLLPPAFVAAEPWNPKRIRALAMYCSDGRWGDAFDEFCHERLWIPRYDRFAVPGGPAWLTDRAWPSDPSRSGQPTLSPAAWEQLELLVRVHELQRIILIAHYGCAFYMERLGRDADRCLPVQIDDLKQAADSVAKEFRQISVESFVAMREGERLAFHRMA